MTSLGEVVIGSTNWGPAGRGYAVGRGQRGGGRGGWGGVKSCSVLPRLCATLPTPGPLRLRMRFGPGVFSERGFDPPPTPPPGAGQGAF